MYTIIANSKKRKKALPDYSELKLGNITYYKFEETKGTVSYDSVGSRNATSSGLNLGTIGLIDKGISSTGGYGSKVLSIPHAAINQNALYISTWYYAESDSRFNLEARNFSTGYGIRVLGTTDMINVIYYGKITFPSVSADLNFNQWNHIVIEKTGGAMKIYINNVLKFNDSHPSYNIVSKDTYLGAEVITTGGISSYKFKVDELGIWNRPLTSDERTLLYNNGNGINLYP